MRGKRERPRKRERERENILGMERNILVVRDHNCWICNPIMAGWMDGWMDAWIDIWMNG